MIRLSERHGVNPMLSQCPLCGGDTNELILLGRLPDDKQAPMRGVVSGVSQPCDTCKHYMQQGIMLIVVRDGSDRSNPYRIGEIHVITEDAASRIFNDAVLRSRCAFIEETTARQLGIAKPTA